MNQQLTRHYAERIYQVCDYIQSHLDEELSVETLSQVALFSKFHFHRQFADFMGVNVARYILLARLKRASYQLAFSPEKKIIDIALAAGFENPESFSRAFKHTFSQTPSQFRKQPDWAVWHNILNIAKPERIISMQTEIVTFPEIKIAVKEHRGAPDLLNESISEFINWRKQTGLSPVSSSGTFGLAYDDPDKTVAADFRFDICGEVKGSIPQNEQGVINKTIPAGRRVKIRHYGSHDLIGQTVYYLYGEWLPQSGEELQDFPCYFHYLNLIPNVDEHELITDIYLLLK